MGRGVTSIAAAGFNQLFGPGRYGARVSEAEQAQRLRAAERSAWLQRSMFFTIESLGSHKIQAVKIIRAATGWSLTETVNFINELPGRLPVTGEQAETLAAAFEDHCPEAEVSIEDLQDERDPQLPLGRDRDAVEISISEVGERKIAVIKCIRAATGWSLRESKVWVEAIANKPMMVTLTGRSADQLLAQLSEAEAAASSRELGPITQWQTSRSRLTVLVKGDRQASLKAYQAVTHRSQAAAEQWLDQAPTQLVLSTTTAQTFAQALIAVGAAVRLLPVPEYTA
jgi:ribosomal protein L7/L12